MIIYWNIIVIILSLRTIIFALHAPATARIFLCNISYFLSQKFHYIVEIFIFTMMLFMVLSNPDENASVTVMTCIMPRDELNNFSRLLKSAAAVSHMREAQTLTALLLCVPRQPGSESVRSISTRASCPVSDMINI